MSEKLSCRALLFDLDGTLVDSAPDLWHAMNHVLTRLGYPRLALEQVRHLVGNGARFLLARGMYGLEADAPDDDPEFEAAVRLFLDYYSDHMTDNSRPYPDCVETLEYLAAKQLPMAVVTNKPQNLAEKMLRHLKMKHFFSHIVGGDTLSERKPNPLPLLHTLEQMQAPPELGVMVGDSQTDSQAARAARCQLVLVSHGYNRGVPVSTLAPDHVIDGFAQLPNILEYV